MYKNRIFKTLHTAGNMVDVNLFSVKYCVKLLKMSFINLFSRETMCKRLWVRYSREVKSNMIGSK